MTNQIWLQGMEHGWVGTVTSAERTEPRTPRRHRFDLSRWTPAAILRLGGTVTRDTERQYMDLQGARDARESGR